MENKIRESYYLAEDYSYGRGWSKGPASGWWYDGRGAKTLERNYAPYPISNIAGDAPTGMIRELRKTGEGVITALVTVNIKSGFDGLFIRLYDSDKNDAACMYTKDGAYYALGKAQKEVLLAKEERQQGVHHIRIDLNFDTKKVTYYIDNVSLRTVALTAKYIKFYKIGTFAGNVIDVDMGATHIYANYTVNQRFSFFHNGTLPIGWNAYGEGGSSVSVDRGDLVLKTEEGAVTASCPFAPQSGKLCFESFFFMPELKDGAAVTLYDGEKPALSFYTKGGDFCVGRKHLRYALNEMWYRLRFELDLDKQTALIKVNGKKTGSVKLQDIASIDRLEYSLSADNAELRVDRILLFHLIDYPDYCPKPKLPKGKEDYVIGMNMCSLWHTGSHVGWDCVTPYPEIRPVIGYYDEGLPEVADWEIKFMLEHGIDFQLYCWYSSQTNAPIKTTGLSEAIHDGYFNCKYSEMSRFALLWEAANAAHPAGLEAFKRYFVPYWIEQFFTDSRYMRIDNKAIMAVFGTSQLIRDFGSPEGVHEAFDYLRAEVKKLGYDDLIIMSCGAPSDAVKRCGFDAAYAYNWGKQGYDAEYTEKAILTQQALNLVHVVPTASTGFNNVAWAETRSPDMTAEDFHTLHLKFRDEMLPTFTDKPDWAKKFIMMSNWNEYGEGTYIMPCEKLNGFGYLDAVRDVYTQEHDVHKDDVPTPHQLARLSYLYPQERKMIRTQNYYKFPDPDKVIKKYDFGKIAGEGHWAYEGCDAEMTDKGSFKGVSHDADPKIMLKDRCSISMNGATHVRIRGKVTAPATIEVFYITESAPKYVQAQSFSAMLTPEKDSGICALGKQPGLDTPIIGLRVDPAAQGGIGFDLEGIDLMKDTSKPEFYLDGVEQPINSPVVEKGGYTLFPFNPYHVLVYKLGLYYEYNDTKKELSFYSKDASVVFTLGTRNVVINGEKQLLNIPVESFDGLPMLPLEVLAKVFGFRFTYKAPKLTIRT